MSTTAMMIRPMKTMTRSLPVNRDGWPPRAAGGYPQPAQGVKTRNLFLESVVVFEPWKAWDFLTNHGRVLPCIAHDPGGRLRDIAAMVGITAGRQLTRGKPA